MTQSTWNKVDFYYGALFGGADPVMDSVIAASRKAGLPSIQISPLQGRLLMLLAQAAGARRILEIGTLGGYSAIWLARALPTDGRLVTLEYEPHHAAVAQSNIAYAGFPDRIEILQGAAADTLRNLAVKQTEAFDFIFIDADKASYPLYLELSFSLARVGTLILADNMVRDGEVADAKSNDPAVRGVRKFNEMMAADRRLTATAIQTVGEKGYDGFVLARVVG